MAEEKKGFVYVLTNPSIPDKVNIGHVKSDNIGNLERRVRQHSSKSVPEPFNLHYAVRVDDAVGAERLLHDAFGWVRKNRREFFEVEPERVVAAMNLILVKGSKIDGLDMEGVSVPVAAPKKRKAVSRVDNKQKTSNRRPPFNFSECGIPRGAELTFFGDLSIKAKVIGDKNEIEFKGKESTLSQAVKGIRNRKSAPAKGGSARWEYKGKKLSDIYKKILESAK